MGSTTKYQAITTFDSLQTEMNNQLVRLRRKENESYWPRYLVRRISLYAIPALMFFGFFFSLGLSKNIGFDKVNAMLGNIDFLPMTVSILLSVITALLAVLLLQWKLFNSRCIQCLSATEKISNDSNYKLMAHILIILFCVSVFFLLYKTKFTVYYGLLAFFILTFLPLLVDRTLGITRRNERFTILIRKLERLNKLNISRRSLAVTFQEVHLLEYMKILEDADDSKTKDTVSDTSYIMSQLEKLKS